MIPLLLCHLRQFIVDKGEVGEINFPCELYLPLLGKREGRDEKVEKTIINFLSHFYLFIV